MPFKLKKDQEKRNMGEQSPNESGILAEQPQVVEDLNKGGAHPAQPQLEALSSSQWFNRSGLS